MTIFVTFLQIASVKILLNSAKLKALPVLASTVVTALQSAKAVWSIWLTVGLILIVSKPVHPLNKSAG